MFENGLTVWETGTLLYVPSMENLKVPIKLWVVAKVLREIEAPQSKLNLDNSSSSSEEEEDTRETYEIRDPFREELQPKKQAMAIERPRLTLVFMAYEKRPDKKGENLINVSHLACKFAQDSYF
jgi:hypothetical protein